MARINTKAFAFFLKSGATLPVTPANFLELGEKLLMSPTTKTENIKVYNGKLGANDSYADACDTTLEGASFMHRMRYQNAAADALDTVPSYGELLKIGGFSEAIVTTSGQETVIYTWNKDNSPALGSAVYYLDGKKQTMTNTVALNTEFNFTVGEIANITGTMSAFLDNYGVASFATLVLSSVTGLAIGDVLTGDTSSATGTVIAITGTTVELKGVTGTFTVGGEALNTAAYTSTSANQSNPTVTLGTEGSLVVGCADVYSKDGTAVIGANNISINMGAMINKYYGFSLKEYETSDFESTITMSFPVDATDYNDAIEALQAQSLIDIVVKLGTDATSTEVNGKTVVMTITNCKLSSYSDGDENDSISRTENFILTASSAFTIKHGFYA